MPNPTEKIWDHERQRRNHKLERAASVLGASLRDKAVPADLAVQLLEAVLEPGDRVCLEGNNQKQADFLVQGGLRGARPVRGRTTRLRSRGPRRPRC